MSASPNGSASDLVMVPLDRIPTDSAAQTRAQVRAAVAGDYAAAMTRQLAEGGLRFPPVVLFTDGHDYWVGDGFHRLLAARQVGLTEIAAEVRPGTARAALLFGIGANGAHGLARTNADKRKAVGLLLADAEWGQRSDREIARRCQVGNALVSRLRRRLSVSQTQMTERKVQRGGTVYEMHLADRSAEATAARSALTPGAVPPTDPLGIPLPETRANVFAALGDFHEAYALFDRLVRLLDRIAQGPAGELYRQELVRTTTDGQAGFACPALRVAHGKLAAAEPYCAYCPTCQEAHPGRIRPACRICGGRGWTTRVAFESCPERDRQHAPLDGRFHRHAAPPGTDLPE